MDDIWFLGVDPGVSGAYALYNNSRDYVVEDFCGDLLHISEYISKFNIQFAILEFATGIPKQSSSTTFTQAENYGMWKAILTLNAVPFSIERATDWRKLAGLHIPTYKTSSSLSKSQNANKKRKLQKQYLLETGRQRFPEADLKRVSDVDRAEALFIATAASKIMNGENND